MSDPLPMSRAWARLLVALALTVGCGVDDHPSSAGETDTTSDGFGSDTFIPPVPSCDPIADQGCGPSETCTWASPDAEFATCEMAGSGALDEACEALDGCETGVCLALNGTEAVCHALCETEADCPDEAPCLTPEEAPFAVCESWSIYSTCVLLDPTSCPDDRGCYVVGTQPDAVCLTSGAGEAGEACDVANGCQAGGACVDGVCRALCDLAAETPCLDPLQTCTLYYQGAGICPD